uniref:PSD13 N-terminal domain-containing protein n=1 Tax=Globodera rostochiensis TaxID=31243 RepID=A0A914HV60_GLORO
MTEQRVENYLKDQTGSDNPLVAKGFQNLMNLYTNELWNELWQESSRLVRDIDFVLAVDLPQFYEEFIRDFERRIEPLQLVELVTLIAENIFYTDRQKAFDFLDNFDNLRRKDTPTPVASTCTDLPLVRPHNSSTWADACSKGLLDIVQHFVENGQGVDDTDEKGLSGLMYSSEAGKVDVVRFLLSKGAHVDRTTHEGVSPLLFAAKGGHLEVCKLLIANGAGTNQKSKDGETPWFEVCMRGHLDIVKHFVNERQDIEVSDIHGHTGLMYAIRAEQLRVVRFLVEEAAAIYDAPDVQGHTALTVAVAKANTFTEQPLNPAELI